ncbi:hypothetical protein B2J93_1440 [Marssonina coronariae]|uniref:Uncharacterized protein n=1 Tax=Diplocarpon coronariae TaxID=2795749 RepID=A0A218YYA7_9HELO|nr:hypothetical protein B2J93_1440 [Marssonina coronariae]
METEPQAPSIQELKELETANLRVAHARSYKEYAATPSEQIYARFPLRDPSKAPPPQASYKDIKDEYKILIKEHHMRKETWKTQRKHYELLLEWVSKTVDGTLLASAMAQAQIQAEKLSSLIPNRDTPISRTTANDPQAILVNQQLSLQGLVSILKRNIAPSDEAIQSQTRLQYRDVLRRGKTERTNTQQ